MKATVNIATPATIKKVVFMILFSVNGIVLGAFKRHVAVLNM